MEEKGVIIRFHQEEEEPPIDSVVIDRMGDAWQRFTRGWNCAFHVLHVGEYCDECLVDYTWTDLRVEFGPVKVVYTPEPKESKVEAS